MKRYAFIDVSNTNGTAQNILDFKIDYEKLFNLLTNKKWNCDEIFYYKGSQKWKSHQRSLRRMTKIGYTVRTKDTHNHPDKLDILEIPYPKLKMTILHKHTVRGNKKSNCDVELTVDAIDKVIDNNGDEIEFLIFTGDGDFKYLVESLINKNVKIKIVSNKGRDLTTSCYRFSTRLVDIIRSEEQSGQRRVKFLDIKDWKDLIKKKN